MKVMTSSSFLIEISKKDHKLWEQLCKKAGIEEGEVTDRLPASVLLDTIKESGLRLNDDRIVDTVRSFQFKKVSSLRLGHKMETRNIKERVILTKRFLKQDISTAEFTDIIHSSLLVEKALNRDLVIPDFPRLVDDVRRPLFHLKKKGYEVDNCNR